MAEFSNWHRAASEELIAAVHGDTKALDKAQYYAEKELREALSTHNVKREVLARGILRTIEEVRQVPN